MYCPPPPPTPITIPGWQSFLLGKIVFFRKSTPALPGYLSFTPGNNWFREFPGGGVVSTKLLPTLFGFAK